MAKKFDPWAGVRELFVFEAPIDSDDDEQKLSRNLLTDADKLRKVALLADDMLEDAEIWSVNPVKLKRLRKAVEALPERLLSGPLS